MIDHFRRLVLPVATAAATTLVLLGAPHGATPSASAEFVRDLTSLAEPTEAELRDQLLAEEAALVAGVDDLHISRQSSATKSGKTTNFVIKAWVMSGSTYIYRQLWACERTWSRPNACNNFEDRRAEFFAAALNTLHHERSSRATAQFDVPKLRDKSEIDLYEGAPFFLVNNLSRERNQPEPGQPHTCLDVFNGYGGVFPGARLRLGDCQFDRAEWTSLLATDQVWRFVPGTGLLRNEMSGLCLDVEGSVMTQVEGSPVVVDNCDFSGGWEAADQQWGLHPLGYLVNLSAGRCLDMNGASTTNNGSEARVLDCEYELSAKVNSPGSPEGLVAADPVTDQSWSLSFLDGGLHPTLSSHQALDPRAVPPETRIIAAPPARITEYDAATIAFGSNMVNSTFECKVNGGSFAPCTSPFDAHSGRRALGNYSFQVRATNRYGLVDLTDAVTLWEVVRPL